jgi:hypothetical protein
VGLPSLPWKSFPVPPQQPEPEEARAQALKDPALFEYFVKDCHVYVTLYINKKLGVVNGEQGRYHSLSFQTQEEQDLFESLVMTTPSAKCAPSQTPSDWKL